MWCNENNHWYNNDNLIHYGRIDLMIDSRGGTKRWKEDGSPNDESMLLSSHDKFSLLMMERIVEFPLIAVCDHFSYVFYNYKGIG